MKQNTYTSTEKALRVFEYGMSLQITEDGLKDSLKLLHNLQEKSDTRLDVSKNIEQLSSIIHTVKFAKEEISDEMNSAIDFLDEAGIDITEVIRKKQ